MTRSISANEVRTLLVTRREVAIIDVRSEALFATGHPLFASQLGLAEVEREAPARIPLRTTTIAVYDNGEGLADRAAAQLGLLGYQRVFVLDGKLDGWRRAGFELFQDVNSYSKAFGELVEARRHTPAVSADELHAMLEAGANVIVLDARRFDEYHTMSIPSSISVPGAELVLYAGELAKDPATTVVVNCAGRTRSIIGAQSLVNAGFSNKVAALCNGTIGWTLAGKRLETSQIRRAGVAPAHVTEDARRRARNVAYRAGVRRVGFSELGTMLEDAARTTYRFDVRTPEEFAAGHFHGFASAPGGQLVQETDFFAPVRGARIVLSDPMGVRADMTASWLAQMAWDVYVLEGGAHLPLAKGSPPARVRPSEGRYKRPYEGTDNPREAMEAYLQWEYGLVDQLARDGSHGFFVI